LGGGAEKSVGGYSASAPAQRKLTALENSLSLTACDRAGSFNLLDATELIARWVLIASSGSSGAPSITKSYAQVSERNIPRWEQANLKNSGKFSGKPEIPT
jgi:hypothetical protein